MFHKTKGNKEQAKNKRGRKAQRCHICGEPGIPGFKPGWGMCQYHRTAKIWGKEWADKCKLDNSDQN